GALNIPSAADVERLTRRLRSVSQRLEGLEDGVDRLDQRLAGLGAVASIEARLTAIEEGVAGITREVAALREALRDGVEAVPRPPSACGLAALRAASRSGSAGTRSPAPSARLVPSAASASVAMTSAPRCSSSISDPHVPTRTRRRAPRSTSSRTTIAALGPPI